MPHSRDPCLSTGRIFQIPGAHTPLGNPFTLDPYIAAPAFLPTPLTQAPWTVRTWKREQSLFQGFQKRRYCSTCGYPFGQHESGQYGPNCTDNCGYEECSKCKMRLEFHHKENNIVLCGPWCPNEAHPESICHDWMKPSKR
jgi:hypothetical protein